MTTSSHWFDIEPVPASRPRIRTFQVKGRTISSAYYAGKYKQFMIDAEKAIPRHEQPHPGNLAVLITCYVTKPKTTKRSNPNGDIDNYVKGVLDAMTKKNFWNDDDQVVDLHVHKKWANKIQTGIHVVITEVD